MALGLVSYVQLASTELALKSIEQQQRASALPDDIPAGSAPITDDPADENLPELKDSTIQADETVEFGEIDGEMTGAAFMQRLKTWIAELSAAPVSVHQGRALSQALASGTLNIFDPLEGITVTAWDAESDQPTTKHRQEIPATGWSQFLKQRVMRDDAGYRKDADGNYIDLISGENAYFGAIGNRFVYLTWPKLS